MAARAYFEANKEDMLGDARPKWQKFAEQATANRLGEATAEIATTDPQARREVTARLGHARASITHAYYGKASPATAEVPIPPRAEAQCRLGRRGEAVKGRAAEGQPGRVKARQDTGVGGNGRCPAPPQGRGAFGQAQVRRRVEAQAGDFQKAV